MLLAQVRRALVSRHSQKRFGGLGWQRRAFRCGHRASFLHRPWSLPFDPKARQSVERRLDAPAQLVEALVEGERLFPIAAIWNDRFGAALVQLLAQFGAVIGRVAEHALRWLHSSDQALCERTIVRLASSQQDGDKSSISICECMNLRVAPSARAANSLLLLPPYGWPAPLLSWPGAIRS